VNYFRATSGSDNSSADDRSVHLYAADSSKKLQVFRVGQRIDMLRWVAHNVLAIVTTTSVLHWNIEKHASSTPKTIFMRDPRLAGSRVVDYRYCANSGVAALEMHRPVSVSPPKTSLPSTPTQTSQPQLHWNTAAQLYNTSRNATALVGAACATVYDGAKIGPNWAQVPLYLKAGWNAAEGRGEVSKHHRIFAPSGLLANFFTLCTVAHCEVTIPRRPSIASRLSTRDPRRPRHLRHPLCHTHHPSLRPCLYHLTLHTRSPRRHRVRYPPRANLDQFRP